METLADGKDECFIGVRDCILNASNKRTEAARKFYLNYAVFPQECKDVYTRDMYTLVPLCLFIIILQIFLATYVLFSF